MMFRAFLYSISLLACSTALALANDADRLRPRVDTSLKYGSERSIGSGELWIPLSQGDDRVLYGDLRFMGDDADNREGNAGIGYRQIVAMPAGVDAIAGGHVWIDRRKTEHDSTFHQLTAGAELLGEDWDLRANAYLPLNDEKTHRTSRANGQSTAPYLAGSGIFYDIGGQTVTTLTEEPQPGLDLELGWRMPIFEGAIDAIRLYGGGYHFSGDQTPNVTGWRTRLVADISQAVSIGGRFQKDDERGSQGFLEATVRFPFQAKRSFRRDGLKARLDESPERDIDIVAGSKATSIDTPGQERVPVLATATGQQQRVLHVDNTAAPGGDGSKERPFNELKAAEAAMQPYDVVYLHAGDGTTTGQDKGIVIDEPGVSLIGSGVDFVYDGGKFTAGSGKEFGGIVLVEATMNPLISNTTINPNAGTDQATGSGVVITESHALISGLTIANARQNGIILLAGVGTILEDINISRVLVQSSTRDGVRIDIDGIGTTINSTTINDVEAINNRIGFLIYARNGGLIDEININNSNSHGNTNGGMSFLSEGSSSEISDARLREVNSFDNVVNGINVSAINTSKINISFEHVSAFGNQETGIYINDDTSDSFIADFGGGNLGSTGGNSIYGNGTSIPETFRDLRLDLDGGTVAAQDNWWGQAGGPTVGQIISEGACPGSCGTADTANPLDHDPNL